MVFLSHVPKIHIAIKKALKPNFNIKLQRINTNIQFKLQDSAFHIDGMYEGSTKYWTWTFVIFTAPTWNIQWGGEFCYMTPDYEYHYVPYIPGNAVLFNGWLDHKGNAPNLMSHAIRQSVAYTFMCQDPNVPII